ncbi:MAG TPA: AraC family transcriptional regulator [Flavobacteriaceae bacterium]|nr:AraC family transcriptional regulator [Flavobacteriaceae bacterium]
MAHSGDFDAAYDCLEAIRPEIEHSDSSKLIFRFYSNIAEFQMIQGQNEQSLELIDRVLKKYDTKLTADDKIGFQIIQLQILETQQHSSEIFERIQKLLPETQNWRYRASLFTLRASSYVDIGKYESGIQDFYEALRLFESKNDTINILTLFNRIGLLHDELGQPEKALEILERAYIYAEKFRNVESLSAVYNNLGIVHQKIGRLDKAINYFTRGLELVESNHFELDKARFLSNLGGVYLEKGDLPNAFKSLNESLKISTDLGILKGILFNYRSLASAHMQNNDFENTRKSLDSALKYSKVLQNPNMESEIYLIYSDFYRKRGDYKNAFASFKAGDSIDKILKREDAQKALADIEAKYKIELKDQELEKIQLEFAKKKAENKTLKIGVGGGIMLFALILAFLSYRNNTLRKLYDRNIELLKAVNYYKVTPDITDDREQLKVLFDRLLDLVNNEKIFTNPLLGIKDVAEMLNSNEKYVSSAIAKYSNMNYSNFINFYRINEAKQLINEMKLANLNEIMQASGFNSRTTFYNAFKNFTGLSPKQFKNMRMEMADA